MTARTIFLAALAAAACGCSGSGASETRDLGAAAEASQRDSARSEGSSGTKQPGEACSADGECASAICYQATCARRCSAPAECAVGQDCTSDDGKRTFCHTPAYPKGVGSSCAISGSCPTGTSCWGGVSWAPAYCTADCKSDVDCPATHHCSEYTTGKRHCIRRLFCTRCYHDGNCGAGKLCVKQGSEGFCSRACTPGQTECPRFAECKTVGGAPRCVHKAGKCDGDGALCQPCHNSDCAASSFCIANTFTGEQFCGQDCKSKGCPSSKYDCVDVGGGDQQCVPHYDSSLKQMQGCVSVSPIGEVGDVLEDFATIGYADAGGSVSGKQLQVLRLSEVASKAKVVLFNISAGWCNPCQQETQHSAALLSTYGPQGLAIFQVLFESATSGEPPSQAFLDKWVISQKAAGAVGIDVDAESIIYNTTGVTPVNLIVDAKTLKVLDKSYGYSQTQLETKLKSYLGQP